MHSALVYEEMLGDLPPPPSTSHLGLSMVRSGHKGFLRSPETLGYTGFVDGGMEAVSDRG